MRTGISFTVSPTVRRRLRAPLAFLYISAISYVGAFLFVAVDRLEPSPRLALIVKCAILAAGGAAIAKQLLP
jgi:hypothetical protein